jgi:hypothetical protein
VLACPRVRIMLPLLAPPDCGSSPPNQVAATIRKAVPARAQAARIGPLSSWAAKTYANATMVRWRGALRAFTLRVGLLGTRWLHPKGG